MKNRTAFLQTITPLLEAAKLMPPRDLAQVFPGQEISYYADDPEKGNSAVQAIKNWITRAKHLEKQIGVEVNELHRIGFEQMIHRSPENFQTLSQLGADAFVWDRGGINIRSGVIEFFDVRGPLAPEHLEILLQLIPNPKIPVAQRDFLTKKIGAENIKNIRFEDPKGIVRLEFFGGKHAASAAKVFPAEAIKIQTSVQEKFPRIALQDLPGALTISNKTIITLLQEGWTHFENGQVSRRKDVTVDGTTFRLLLSSVAERLKTIGDGVFVPGKAGITIRDDEVVAFQVREENASNERPKSLAALYQLFPSQFSAQRDVIKKLPKDKNFFFEYSKEKWGVTMLSFTANRTILNDMFAVGQNNINLLKSFPPSTKVFLTVRSVGDLPNLILANYPQIIRINGKETKGFTHFTDLNLVKQSEN